jgi:hypothetical protein
VPKVSPSTGRDLTILAVYFIAVIPVAVCRMWLTMMAQAADSNHLRFMGPFWDELPSVITGAVVFYVLARMLSRGASGRLSRYYVRAAPLYLWAAFLIIVMVIGYRRDPSFGLVAPVLGWSLLAVISAIPAEARGWRRGSRA